MSVPNHPVPAKWRFLLLPLAVFYRFIMVCRNLFYRIGVLPVRSLPTTVISIGNITSGGTGKTPTVVAVANWLQEEGYSAGILSRGYGRITSGLIVVTEGDGFQKSWRECGDEPAMMAQLTKGIPIVVDENRYRGGRHLYRLAKPDVIILDDAFQHRSIARNIDLVLVNAGDSLSDHQLLPLGSLREPWRQLNRATAIILSKSNLYQQQPFLRNRLKQIEKPCFSTEFTFRLKCVRGEAHAGPFVMVSAIGDPESFRMAIDREDIALADEIIYPDHHEYSPADIHQIGRTVTAKNAGGIICTDKDWIKLASLETPFAVFVLSVDVLLPNDLKTFIAAALPR